MGKKSLAEAYILGISFGLIGAHHFYLRRKFFGILYACTLGLLGIGYLFDLVRMRWLVKHANKHYAKEKILSDCYLIGAVGGWFGAHHFYLGNTKLGVVYTCTLGVFTIGWIVDLVRMKTLMEDSHYEDMDEKSIVTAYILGVSPLGIFGAHHFYFGNTKLGVVYACTLGVFTIGWIVDLVRMKTLLEDPPNQTKEKSIVTAYILGVFPLGIFGAHHYYFENWKLGLVYTFTLGIFGIGWIIDLFRMKKLASGAGQDRKSVSIAYIMAVPPFGILGAYHYYLGNYKLGITYTFTLGLFGFGWMGDLYRMKHFVAASNDPNGDELRIKQTAYALCGSPLGIFGVHHFYIKRYWNGVFFAATFGLFGFGWIFDMLRMDVLYVRYLLNDKHRYLDDAYLLWFPFGIFGLHQFYLGRNWWGLLYAYSLGCFGVGWIIDGFRLPSLVDDYNDIRVQDHVKVEFKISRIWSELMDDYQLKPY